MTTEFAGTQIQNTIEKILVFNLVDRIFPLTICAFLQNFFHHSFPEINYILKFYYTHINILYIHSIGRRIIPNDAVQKGRSTEPRFNVSSTPLLSHLMMSYCAFFLSNKPSRLRQE